MPATTTITERLSDLCAREGGNPRQSIMALAARGERVRTLTVCGETVWVERRRYKDGSTAVVSYTGAGDVQTEAEYEAEMAAS